MIKDEFYEIFEDFRYNYKNKKDGGWDEFYAIVNYIKRLDNQEQNDFIKYCLEEIKSGNDIDWYSDIISKVQNPIAIDLLYDIFTSNKGTDNEFTKKILGTLFELKDCDEKQLLEYENYIDTYINVSYSIDNYFLILKYLFINPIKSINIISGYFNTLFLDAKYVNSTENFITFLAYCEMTSFEYFYQLMNIVKTEYPLLEIKLNDVLKELYYSDRLYYDKRIKSEIKKYVDLYNLGNI